MILEVPRQTEKIFKEVLEYVADKNKYIDELTSQYTPPTPT